MMRARSSADRWLASCDAVGDGAELVGRPTVRNRGRIEIGKRFRLVSRPVRSHLVTGPSGHVSIADDVAIAHGAAVASFLHVSIGAGTRIGPFVVIMDTDFHVIGDRSERHEATAVSIGRGVQIGSRVTVLRGASIGDGAAVEAGSVVSGPVPAGARVGGVPAREIVKDAGAMAPEDVPLLVMKTLGLRREPQATAGPPEISEWDSLGSLKLLLALEEAFSVSLKEDDIARVRNVGELIAIVARAMA